VPEVALLPLQLPEAEHPTASVDDHVRVATPPELTVEGAAERLTDGPLGVAGVDATFAVTV
jgi:hypothetical protein